MKGLLDKVVIRNHKKIIFTLLPLLIISATLSGYSLSKPSTTTNQINENTSEIETSYDFKATVTRNVLYPKGGTVEAGEKIFRRITTSIPFNMKSTINSEKDVIAKGIYEVQLVVKAGDLWERSFPLTQKQAFELKGTELVVLDNEYKIDLEKINAFIKQVEDETGIRPSQYALEVVPNVQGTIDYAGKESAIQVQDKLVFQFSSEEITLASEKTFASTITFTTTEIITHTFNVFDLSLPLGPVRLISTLLSTFILIIIIFVFINWMTTRIQPVTTQVEKINKKYGKRIISVSQKINIAEKSIFTLYSFKSVVTIADDKELPIFFYRGSQDESATYFVVDGDYLYSYETSRTDLVPITKKEAGNDKAYAVS